MPYVGDFIGATTRNTRVAILDYPQDEQVRVYAAYDDEILKRIAMMNFVEWDAANITNTADNTADSTDSGSTSRPSQFVALKGLEVDCITVKYLTSPEGAHASADSMTWAGSQWTRESNGMEVQGVRDDTVQLEVKDGCVDVEIEASSALIVYL